ncbi:MAG: dihydrofolate reductase family protein [bacterium]|nr:dihydrofolate reductase family protein [bacterium]
MKVTLLMAQTVDGKVAHGRNEFIDWTSKEDKKFFVAETKRAGAVIMGRATFDTIGRPLPGRTIFVMTRTPRESIEDEKGKVIFSSASPKELIAAIESLGFPEAILAGGPTINTLFLKDNLIDEIKLTIEPKLFGAGIPLFDGTDIDKLPITELELMSTTPLTPQVILLHYRVVTGNS